MDETFKASIISGKRITIPDYVFRKYYLNIGDVLQVTIRKPIKHMKDVIL